MKFEERKEKLVRVLESGKEMDREELASYILTNGFDYVREVAARTIVETLKAYDQCFLGSLTPYDSHRVKNYTLRRLDQGELFSIEDLAHEDPHENRLESIMRSNEFAVIGEDLRYVMEKGLTGPEIIVDLEDG